MSKLQWWGIVIFHCMQINDLVISMAITYIISNFEFLYTHTQSIQNQFIEYNV